LHGCGCLTAGCQESVRNPTGFLSRLVNGIEPRQNPTLRGIGVAEPFGLIAVAARNPSIRHTSARSPSPIKLFPKQSALDPQPRNCQSPHESTTKCLPLPLKNSIRLIT
jgi:hypothetical protein